MRKLKNCIDCGVKMNKENRSKHQPAIKCLKCFDIFADKTTKLLEDMIKILNQ